MRITRKKLIYYLGELIFYGVAPLALIFAMYGNIDNTPNAVGFKIAAPGIILLVVCFLCLKKLFINKKLADAHSQLNTLKAGLKVASSKTEIQNTENAIKNIGTIEAILSAVVPILLFLLLIICCKVMEQQLVKLSGTCGFIMLSYILGTVFSVLDAREIHSKHGGENNG